MAPRWWPLPMNSDDTAAGAVRKGTENVLRERKEAIRRGCGLRYRPLRESPITSPSVLAKHRSAEITPAESELAPPPPPARAGHPETRKSLRARRGSPIHHGRFLPILCDSAMKAQTGKFRKHRIHGDASSSALARHRRLHLLVNVWAESPGVCRVSMPPTLLRLSSRNFFSRSRSRFSATPAAPLLPPSPRPAWATPSSHSAGSFRRVLQEPHQPSSPPPSAPPCPIPKNTTPTARTNATRSWRSSALRTIKPRNLLLPRAVRSSKDATVRKVPAVIFRHDSQIREIREICESQNHLHPGKLKLSLRPRERLELAAFRHF